MPKIWNPKDKMERPTCPLVTPSGSRCLQNCVNLIVHDTGEHSCMFHNFLETFAVLSIPPSLPPLLHTKRRGRPKKEVINEG